MSSKVIAIKRSKKRVELWHTSLSERWKQRVPPTRRQPPTNVRKKDLTKSQRLEAISILRVKCIDGRFERGAIVDVAKRFNMARTTIWRLWQRVACTRAVGIINSPELVSWKKIPGKPLSICQSLLRRVSRTSR